MVDSSYRWPFTVNRRARWPGLVNAPRTSGAAPPVQPLPVPVDFMLSRSTYDDALTKTGALYNIPAGGAAIPSTDLRGKRVMIVLADATSPLLAGTTAVTIAADAFPDTTPGAVMTVGSAAGPRMEWTAGLHVVEFEVISTGRLRVWRDGFEYAERDIDTAAALTVDKVGGVAASQIADVVIMPGLNDIAGNQIREVLLRQHVPALAPVAQADVPVFDTGRTMMLDPQMEPKQLIAADSAQGIDQTNPANPGYYHDLAYKNHAEAPVSISGTVGSMAAVRALLPGVTHLRTGINRWQFDEDGNMLSAAYQQKLDEWVAAGGRWMPVHMWLGQEAWPKPIVDQGTAAEVDYVLNTVPAQYLEGWRRFWLWFAKQPQAMQDAIDVIDLLNEPEIFNRVTSRDPGTPIHVWRRRFVQMQIDAAKLAPASWRGTILSTGWAYSTGYTQLQEVDPYGITPVARLKQALGHRLKWSFHQYPSWMSGSTPNAYFTNTMAKQTFAGPGNLILTEMNSGDFNPETDVDAAGFQMSRVMTRLAKAGVGLGFFPGINFAAAIGFTSGGTPEFRRPDRSFTLIGAATANGFAPYDYTHPSAVVFPSEAEPGGANTTGLRVAVGSTLDATTGHRTMLFGTDGNDTITISPTHWTWVETHGGDDTVFATTGPGAIIFLGEGNDTVHLGAQRLSVYGASGDDTFVLHDSGNAWIDNFDIGADRIDVNGLFPDLASFKAACANVGGHLVITLPGGGKVTLLKRGTTDPSFLVPDLVPAGAAFPPLAGTIHHYRVEDVTADGAGTAHGASLPMAVAGTVGTVDIGGVPFSDSNFALHVDKGSWGDPTFEVWMLLDGSRAPSTALYNGPNPNTTGNNTLYFRAHGQFVVGSGSTSVPTLPAADGPETMNWSMPTNNGNMGQVLVYRDGVSLGAPTSGTLSRIFDWTGSVLILGGTMSNGVPTPTAVKWRDIVIKRGGTFTQAERDALQQYAIERLSGA